MKEYAIFGDPAAREALLAASRKHGLFVLATGALNLCDECECRRWFSRNTPNGVFVALGLGVQLSARNWMLNVAGTLNVIRALMGFTERPRLILAAHLPSNEFFLFMQLIQLLRAEKNVDFCVMAGGSKESLEAFAERCVLHMLDEKSSEGAQQNREVRNQVLPEQAGAQQHGKVAAPVLEVPISPAQSEAPGDLCAQCSASEGQEARDSGLNNPGAVQGMVPPNGLS